jgi:hypothetical protein
MHASVGIVSIDTWPHSGQVSWEVVFTDGSIKGCLKPPLCAVIGKPGSQLQVIPGFSPGRHQPGGGVILYQRWRRYDGTTKRVDCAIKGIAT